MIDRKELSDHVLDLAELANKRFVTSKEMGTFPILAATINLARLLPSQFGMDSEVVYGHLIDAVLNNLGMSTSVLTGVLIGMDLIKERTTQRAIDQIKKAKQ